MQLIWRISIAVHASRTDFHCKSKSWYGVSGINFVGQGNQSWLASCQSRKNWCQLHNFTSVSWPSILCVFVLPNLLVTSREHSIARITSRYWRARYPVALHPSIRSVSRLLTNTLSSLEVSKFTSNRPPYSFVLGMNVCTKVFGMLPTLWPNCGF